MAHPLAALLLAGKLVHEPAESDEDMEMSDKEDAKMDAVRHLIGVVRGVKAEDVHDKDASEALECLHNLLELCRDDDMMMDKESDEDDEESASDAY
jgi:hypothetical protein